jgi:hypothetical protein
MNHVMLFESFINKDRKIIEEATKKELSCWRNTSQDFLLQLLKTGKVKSKNKKFVSLSEDPDSGSQDDYGDVRIEFDRKKILAQGGIYVDYYDTNFWKSRPDIALHVTGFSNEQEYYENSGYEGAEDATENSDFTWEEYCENFNEEQEIVIPQIKMEKGLIKSVYSEKKISTEILNLLEKII